jgi:AraC-like DNA-binding protein
MKSIPVHQLKDRTAKGIEIDYFKIGDPADDDVETLGAHRDDHYIFFLIEKGAGYLMIDFQERQLQAGSIYYVLPSQVHHRIRSEAAEGWFIAVDTVLVAPQYRDIFEHQLLLQQPFSVNTFQLRQCRDLLTLIAEKHQEPGENPFHIQILHSLLQSFLGIAAGYYSCINNPQALLQRPVEISQQFKKLLSSHLRDLKSPAGYASMLNVSAPYLNQALKKVTGFPVSYWIIQEVVMEAKRLLYYTGLNVKEIAHNLGYSDHTYFSRLFKNAVGMSPLAFRALYRK